MFNFESIDELHDLAATIPARYTAAQTLAFGPRDDDPLSSGLDSSVHAGQDSSQNDFGHGFAHDKYVVVPANRSFSFHSPSIDLSSSLHQASSWSFAFGGLVLWWLLCLCSNQIISADTCLTDPFKHTDFLSQDAFAALHDHDHGRRQGHDIRVSRLY